MEQENQKEWKAVEPDVWKPENDGDSVEGVYINVKEGIGMDEKEGRAYYLDTKDGIKMVWGTTVLNSRMSLVEVGKQVRITFKGTETNKKGQPLKIFKVEQR